MNRSPLFYPLNRAGDTDAGGAADLQTDIMRFMAILALCLVAVFALVQSIPLMPTTNDASASSVPEPERIEPIEEPIAAPVAPPPKTESREEAESPATRAPIPTVLEAPPVVAAVEPPVEEGFTLRFESDVALTRLVARNAVGLYAISPQRSLRMSVNRGTYTFWPASAPNQYHEMDTGTVPDAVVTALRRSGSVGANPEVRWGVTLPATMRRQLDGYLADHSSGSLVIETDGNLRLEP